MEFKVRAVEGAEQKSQQEIEEKLLKDAESKNDAANVARVEDGNESSTTSQKQESVPSEDETQKESTQSSELKEEDVLSFIKNRYEKDFTSVDQIFDAKNENEELPEDVKSYFEYKKKTGRGIEDYVKLNKDYSTLSEDQLLSEYFISSGEATDEEDIDILMDDYTFDEELDDEKDIKKIKLAKKKAIAKAKKFLNEQKEMYKQPLESSTVGISEEQQKEIDSYKQYLAEAKNSQEELKRKRNWFVDKTNEVFQDFKGFDFKIGDTTLTFNPGDGDKIKQAQLDSNSFIKKYVDQETGMFNDISGYHKALAVAMHPQKFAEFMYEQGKADATENTVRKMKNVDMTERKAVQVGSRKDGLQIKSISTPSSRGLKIRSNKK
tara:strand:- start:15206 stop:16342 length:1137 start_codon:yes stop_codon:yes gene_type:complete